MLDIITASSRICFNVYSTGSVDVAVECRLLIEATALLWEFINELLSDVTYDDTVRWEDRSAFTFRIIDAHHLAELWGRQKHKSNMNYDKLARALRYYYQMNIIQRVRGQRMTYRYVSRDDERPGRWNHSNRYIMSRGLLQSLPTRCIDVYCASSVSGATWQNG